MLDPDYRSNDTIARAIRAGGRVKSVESLLEMNPEERKKVYEFMDEHCSDEQMNKWFDIAKEIQEHNEKLYQQKLEEFQELLSRLADMFGENSDEYESIKNSSDVRKPPDYSEKIIHRGIAKVHAARYIRKAFEE